MSDTATIYDTNPDLDTTGGRLFRAREATGLTAEELAWRLGVKLSTISNWERDRSQPSAQRLSMVCGILNVSLSWVLHGVGAGPDEGEDEVLTESVTTQLERLKLLHRRTGTLIQRIEGDLDRLRSASP